MTVLVFGLILALAAAAWVIRPIAGRRTAVLVDAAPGALLDADARRRATLASLRELEYDFLGGKLDETDYRAQRDRMSYEALEAIRAAESAERAVTGGRREARIEAAHTCGFANPAGSRFCAGCGKRLR
ncbi:MAG TPA: zinc ribbon domain-containing protein [Longimicrobium sp.]|jgi:hypothetical protein